MKKTKVVLICGLSNGKIIYDYFKKNKFVDLPIVITYLDNTNKPRHINFENNDNIIKTSSANKHIKEIKEVNPDFIFVAGWSELLTTELISIPKNGTIGFHPSKLPLDRGRSTLAWQIREGYKETALSMFYYSDIPDGGDIIAQEKIKIEKNDYVNDILNKIDDVTLNLIKAYFPLLRCDIAPRKSQNLNEGSVRRLLNPNSDTMINWNKNADVLFDKIRATSKPYPGASAIIENKKYRIWKAEVIEKVLTNNNLNAGDIWAKLFDGSIIIKCKKKYLRILDFEK